MKKDNKFSANEKKNYNTKIKLISYKTFQTNIKKILILNNPPSYPKINRKRKIK